MKLHWIALVLLLPLPALGANCRAVDLKEFREATTQGPDRVVFFASWCSSCSRYVTPERVPDTIFVAAADDKAKAEKVLSLYLKDRAASAVCFLDKDESIAKAFGVRNLPMEKSLADLSKP
ncbi:hypothetical protein [Oligoflexus tunisiensis]|uniref:hypothetical protein n=1 Tax=Oligoflexus tunisiensis TaxID=708132 RepID=UPI00114CAF35|nr:hypothetical protein [Oligoflexus tunisiensis]